MVPTPSPCRRRHGEVADSGTSGPGFPDRELPDRADDWWRREFDTIVARLDEPPDDPAAPAAAATAAPARPVVRSAGRDGGRPCRGDRFPPAQAPRRERSPPR